MLEKLNILSEERLKHCIRASEMAKELCEIHNIDNRAVIAAYYHDIAKELSLEEMIELIEDKYLEEIDGMYNECILHGYAGAEYMKRVLGIDDEVILDAVRYHTTGKKKMSDVQKIVYISDAIEAGRNYPNVDDIRKATFENLDNGILMEIEFKIKMLLDNNRLVHKNTIDFRNDLLKKKECR